MTVTELGKAPSPANIPAQNVPFFTPANNAGAAVDPTDENTPTLFRPLTIRDVTFKNRVIVAPMCMYSTVSDPSSPYVGALTDYHISHLGHLALKGAGLVIIEATAVQPNGRISPNDSGLWQDGTDSEQFRGLKRVVDFIHSQGAKVGIQLAHAGRKASTVAPWLAAEAGVRALRADKSVGGWPENVVAPSGGEEYVWGEPGVGFWTPRELSTEEVEELVRAFAKSAALAVQAGVDVIEIHGAHGYLIHEFMSPITNQRTDKYGGSFENRLRFLQEIAQVTREVIPAGMPLFLRISATEWLEGQPIAAERGTWDMSSSLELLKYLPEWEVDFLDVSTGGNHRDQKFHFFSEYQTKLAGQLRKQIRESGAKTLVGAVGFIREAEEAAKLVQGADQEGIETQADAILIARQFLREPEWVINAAKKLGVKITFPAQFGRVF